ININDYLTNGENVCIANPNAPTGIGVETSKIEEILKAHKNDIVIIDEAYVDFGAVSVIPLCKKYDNLLVIGTFSKSRNLAGARIGFAIADAQIIADLNKMKFSFNPYNVNRLSMVIGTKSMEDKAYFETCTQKIIDARKTTTNELEKIGFEVLPSSANFIFAKNDKISGEKLFKKLKENKILVRFFNEEPIKDYLRITIGTDKQMEIFVNTVKKILAENDNL
ncbi:MAG: histidinol-phosphate transaminase, partial [Oscillospiraceae bacterium]